MGVALIIAGLLILLLTTLNWLGIILIVVGFILLFVPRTTVVEGDHPECQHVVRSNAGS
jgi:membrane-bound ClpP family serine protease